MLTTFAGELMLRNFKVLRNKIVIILSMSRIFENALGQPIIRIFIFLLLDYWLGGLTSCLAGEILIFETNSLQS